MKQISIRIVEIVHGDESVETAVILVRETKI